MLPCHPFSLVALIHLNSAVAALKQLPPLPCPWCQLFCFLQSWSGVCWFCRFFFSSLSFLLPRAGSGWFTSVLWFFVFPFLSFLSSLHPPQNNSTQTKQQHKQSKSTHNKNTTHKHKRMSFFPFTFLVHVHPVWCFVPPPPPAYCVKLCLLHWLLRVSQQLRPAPPPPWWARLSSVPLKGQPFGQASSSWRAWRLCLAVTQHLPTQISP